MGRPPIGKQAMSGAERQRRYLDRLLAGKSSATKPKGPDSRDRETFKARIAELEAEVARLLASKPSVTKPAKPDGRSQLTRSYPREAGELDFSEVGKLRAENGKLKSDIFKLKAMLQLDPDAAKLRKKVVDQQVEMAGLRRVLKQTAKERDKYRHRVVGKFGEKYRAAQWLLTRKNHNLLANALHPDRLKQCTPEELAEAQRLAVALRPLFDE
jgi:hypothetical protein